MDRFFGLLLFGGILFSIPLSGSSNLYLDTSKSNFGVFGLTALPTPPKKFQPDTLSETRLPEAMVEGTLLRRVNWEQQPYRTQLIKVVPSTGSNTRTTPELLLNQTGIMVQKTNHGGGSPTLRGLQGNQTLMLVDGIRLNNSIFRYGPNQYLNTVDAFGLDQMEVLFGNGAVQYGSDAMSGTILAKYHEPSKIKLNQWIPHAFLRGMGGNQELSGRLAMDYSTERYGLTVGGTFRNFGDVIAGGDREVLKPTGYRERNVDGKFQWYGKRGTWTIAQQNNNQFGVPVYHKVALENYAYYTMDLQLRRLTYARREWRQLWGLFEKVDVTAGNQSQSEWRSFQKNASNTCRRENDSVATRFVTLKVFGLPRKGFQYVVGFDGYFDRVFSQRKDVDMIAGSEKSLRALYPNQSQNNQTSLFAYATKTGEWGLVRMGARYSGTQVIIPTVELGEITDNNEAVVFDVAASTKLTKQLNIYGNVGSSYRSPNVDDLGTLGIVDFRFEVPQYGLQPEYSLNKELGLKWKSQSLTASLSVYHNALSGLITRVKSPTDSMQGYPVYAKQNVGEAEVKGAELDFSYVVNKKIQLKGGAFITVGDNISGNEPMRRIPPAMFNFQGTYRLNDRWSISAVAYGAKSQTRLAKGDIQDNRIGASGTPGYITGDLRCRYQKKSMYWDLSLTNVGNQLYKTHGSGVYVPGRAIQLLIGF